MATATTTLWVTSHEDGNDDNTRQKCHHFHRYGSTLQKIHFRATIQRLPTYLPAYGSGWKSNWNTGASNCPINMLLSRCRRTSLSLHSYRSFVGGMRSSRVRLPRWIWRSWKVWLNLVDYHMFMGRKVTVSLGEINQDRWFLHAYILY